MPRRITTDTTTTTTTPTRRGGRRTPTTTTTTPATVTPAAVVATPAAVPPTVTPDPVTGPTIHPATPPVWAAYRDAVRGIASHTDMSPDALRADAAIVAAAVAAVVGDRPAPPAGRGRFTGLRTYDFQNTVFAMNDAAGWRVSDRTIAVMWIAELPSNRCDFAIHPRYVASTRTAYVNGRHGSNVVDPGYTAAHNWGPAPARKTRVTPATPATR